MRFQARLAAELRRLASTQPRVLVAIDGPDCAGKTTLAESLAHTLGRTAVRASVDGFHHPREVRVARGELSPEGYYRDSFDLVALERELLRPFAEGAEHVRTRVFGHIRDTADDSGPVPVPPGAVLVLDGVFLLRPELRRWWTLSVYLHVAPETTLERALVRDATQMGSRAEVVRRYEQRYLPGQALYRAEAQPLDWADLVVDNTDLRAPVIVRGRGALAVRQAASPRPRRTQRRP